MHSLAVLGLGPGRGYTYPVGGGGRCKSGAFTRAPAEGSTASFRFLAYGDNRSDDAAHAAVVKAMLATPGDFLIHTGDFVEDGAAGGDWQRFFDIEAPLLRERCVYSAVGNHELTDGAGIAYARYLGPTDPPSPTARLAPEHLDGTMRWGSARFFFLNSLVELRTGVDRSWLDKALADSDAEPGLVWRILVVHHAPWSAGPHGANRMMLAAEIPALLRAHKVDLIFGGHDHIYERGANEGLPYVITGGGGAPTYRVRSALPSTRKVESTRHFVQVAVEGETLKMLALRPDGSTLDQCDLAKGRGWACDAPKEPVAAPLASAAATASAASPVTVSAEGSRCSCHLVGGPAPRALPAVLLGVAVCAGVARRRARRSRAGAGV